MLQQIHFEYLNQFKIAIHNYILITYLETTYCASAVAGARFSLSVTNSTPMNSPIPRTSPITLCLFINWRRLLSR